MLKDTVFGVLFRDIVSIRERGAFNGITFGNISTTRSLFSFLSFDLSNLFSFHFFLTLFIFSITLFWFFVFFISAEIIRLFIELFVWKYLIKTLILRKRCNKLPHSEEQHNLLMEDMFGDDDAELRSIN